MDRAVRGPRHEITFMREPPNKRAVGFGTRELCFGLRFLNAEHTEGTPRKDC